MTKVPKRVKPKNQTLADFLCFALYSANLSFCKAYKPILEQLDLTYTQYIIIVALWEDDNQTVSGLGAKLFLESNTLTPILKKLASQGFVHRQRDTVDERKVMIRLTESGRSLREKALGMGLSDACGLTSEEFSATRESLVKLRGNLIKAIE
jgi:DNA-binding MarR family transcriptional regulator